MRRVWQVKYLILIFMGMLMSSSAIIHDFPGDCNYKLLDKNGSNKKRIIMQRDILLNYTPNQLIERQNFTQILNIDLELEKDDKQYLITLYSQFYSKNVFKTYGMIQQSTKMKLDLINGDHLYLQHLGNSELIGKQGRSVEFASGFSLKKKDVKHLLRHEVESVGIFWTSGYESYEVFNMDIFRDQLTCIHKL